MQDDLCLIFGEDVFVNPADNTLDPIMSEK
jgi:hypothetical protein